MQFVVSKTPADKECSGWYGILPTPVSYPALQQDIEVDWLVVGAGFAGMAAAHRISQHAQAQRVAVIDGQKIGWGAAGRNSGFLIDVPHDLRSKDYAGDNQRDLKEIKSNRFAINYVKSAIESFGLQEHQSDVGKINAAADEAGVNALQRYCRHLDALNEPYSCLDQSMLKDKLGTEYYKMGIHTPSTLLIQPAGYITGMASGLSPSVSFYENTPALKISPGSPTQITTPKGKITARKTILAVNGHLTSFGFFRKQLMHIFLYGSMTRQLTSSELKQLKGDVQWGITPAHPYGSSIRRLKQGRILIRNYMTYNPKLILKPTQLATARARHVKSFKARFPNLREVEMAFTWSGQLCLSLNSVPVFGEIEKNIFSACCQNGLGATKGTLAGLLAADLAMNRDNPYLSDYLNYESPHTLYPEPFMSMGAKTRLWWGQKMAGKEI